MSRFQIAVFAVLSLSVAFPAHAIFYNDSNVIEVEDGIPPEVVTGGTPAFGGAHGGWIWNGETNATRNNSNSPDEESDGSDNPEENGDLPGVGTTEGSAGNSTSNQTTGTLQSLQNVLGSLLDAGVFSGSSAAVNGILAGFDLLSSGASMTIGELLMSGGVLEIDGDEVRRALRSNIDLRSVLENFSPSFDRLDARLYGFVAAKTALKDRNIAKVSFTAAAFEIRYRSRGYLFGLIPITFPVVVRVIPLEATPEARISVKLPWYRFFVRELFTPAGLRAGIDEILVAEMAKLAPDAKEANIALFDAVATYLRNKIGTVSETVAQ